MNIIIETERLELVAATADIVRAEISRRAAFARLLAARVPADWPPQYNDIDSMIFTRDQLDEVPGDIGWWKWYFIVRDTPDNERIAIGCGGFHGPPDEDNEVEVGYSVMEEFQRQGYGSEATAGLIAWAFEQQVQKVKAQTLPELTASIRLLAKNGFAYVGEGSEPGVILYAKNRE
jgi:RimJ/RimL family protein N-acetyltransferase